AHTTTGCGKQGFPSAQPYLSHTPGANPFCCMFLSSGLNLLLAFKTERAFHFNSDSLIDLITSCCLVVVVERTTCATAPGKFVTTVISVNTTSCDRKGGLLWLDLIAENFNNTSATDNEITA
ncbi:hypothetical protein BO82DRAFT_294959, partial [Aspergillus uvarum CBS 121591]